MKQYLDKAQEAERLGVTVRTLERYVEKRSFPFIRLGGRMRFDPDLTDAYLAERRHNVPESVESGKQAA